MQPWADQQLRFARAVLDPAQRVPDGFIGRDGLAEQFRFRVYRNNVTMGLINILKPCYPAVTRLVGEEFFTVLAIEFVRAYPPRSPVLLRYGGDMARFIADFPPCAPLPWLADVARIEWAMIEAHHAAEAEPLAMESLPEATDLGQARLRLHPSLRLVSSRYAAFDLWRLNRGPEEPADDAMAEVDVDEAQHALICRPHAEVEAWLVPRNTHGFVQDLADGLSVGQAMARSREPLQDLAQALEWLMAAGVVVGVNLL
ncbi:MAG: putative DNA-binding domain-containing protein [Hyphomicrobiales bacterium]|nr:putative DNA-binding domain-containing protein [Hyphomicrobiales bacterium]